jgi:hypothetical protein
MHIRPNQLDPNIQLDALHSAQKAAGKAAAARIRKKLSEFASEPAGEAGEAYVVEAESEQNSREQSPKSKESEASRNRRGRPPDSSDSDDHTVSGWA